MVEFICSRTGEKLHKNCRILLNLETLLSAGASQLGLNLTESRWLIVLKCRRLIWTKTQKIVRNGASQIFQRVWSTELGSTQSCDFAL